MIDILVIVILLGLLVAVFASTIPPRQEGMPEYQFKRVARHNAAQDGADPGSPGRQQDATRGFDTFDTSGRG
ncbi:MAG: hypothetical protein V4634_08745 [Pseudomonadota bacterium]